jgi:hypothetical protein
MSQAHSPDQFHISVVEIYNEMICDLLDRGREKEPKKLGVTKTGETEIQRAVEVQIALPNDVQAVLEQTEDSRHRGSTELNLDAESQIAHCFSNLIDEPKAKLLAFHRRSRWV